MSEESNSLPVTSDMPVLMSRQKFVGWLNRRCEFGPPCGKCYYCSIAATVVRGDFDLQFPSPDGEVEAVRTRHREKMETVIKERQACPSADCPCKTAPLPDPDIEVLLLRLDAQAFELQRLKGDPDPTNT